MSMELKQLIYNKITLFVICFLSLSIVRLIYISGQEQVSPHSSTLDNTQDNSQETMGGLLAVWPGANCTYRTQHHLYGRRTKEIKYSPSDYLISKLRNYERLHRRCAKDAEKFSLLLNRNTTGNYSSDCKFIVYISFLGLGNKMLTLTSAFIYALLTNRILLVDRGTDMPDLFCEPISDTSWFLPESFPHKWLHSVGEAPRYRFGKLMKENRCENSLLRSRYIYLHITDTSNLNDKRFFCELEQEYIKSVPWLLLRGDVYFVPNLYYMLSFRTELEKMFPDPESLFRYTARYLFHPTDAVWERTVRYYDSYLDKNCSLIGLQIRPFKKVTAVINRFFDQVSDCVSQRGLAANSTTMLVASLHEVFYRRLREMYVNNTLVNVYTPSHEEMQRTDQIEHDKKALMEIYLLSMSDVVVTSPRSTFGYVAAGLVGLRPWMLQGLKEGGGPACYMLPSPEPCLLLTSDQKCRCRSEAPWDAGSILKRCLDDDVMSGLQISKI